MLQVNYISGEGESCWADFSTEEAANAYVTADGGKILTVEGIEEWECVCGAFVPGSMVCEFCNKNEGGQGDDE